VSAWSVRRRLASFAVALAAVFGVGFGIGSLGTPIDRSEPSEHDPAADHGTAATTTTTTAAGFHQHQHFGRSQQGQP
jgi:hypothetical protein